MFNFKDLVSDILLEGIDDPNAPNWLKEIIKKHDSLFKTNISQDNLQTAFNKSGPGYVAQQEIPNVQTFIRLIAILNYLYKNSKTSKPSNLETFYTTFKDDNNPKATQNILTNTIRNFNNKSDWTIAKFDSDLADIYDKWLGVADQQAKVALETYNNDYILPTTQKIITKRVNFFDRLARLKSPTQPFTNLIVDIFKYPEEYISGRRKVTQDFPDIVDDLYITSVFQVGLAAKKFFASELARLKTEQTNTNQTEPETAQTQQTKQTEIDSRLPAAYRSIPVNQSLNLFDAFYNSILLQEGPMDILSKFKPGNIAQKAKIVGAAAKAGTLNPKAFKQAYNKVYNDLNNYMNFITGKPVQYKRIDAQEKEVGIGTTVPENYTIGSISKMETPEAIDLIKALRSIAQYTRKKTGTGERLKYAQQAMSAVTGLAGHSLYGGVR